MKIMDRIKINSDIFSAYFYSMFEQCWSTLSGRLQVHVKKKYFLPCYPLPRLKKASRVWGKKIQVRKPLDAKI